jgi:ABC-type phosphate transport system permease subunit
MENDAKKIVWTIGAQMIALAVGLLTIALIVWVASKAWKKGQKEVGYNETFGTNWLDGSTPPESGYDATNTNWLGY